MRTMRPDDEATWEADYWDEYLAEFGPGAYVDARYEPTKGDENRGPLAHHSHRREGPVIPLRV